MTRPALLLCLAAAPAQAGYLPAGATDIERGPGYVAYDVAGRDLIKFPDRSALARRIASANRFARSHDGDLPGNQFWAEAVESYRDDPDSFADDHRCKPLLKLLRRDEAHDRATPPPELPPAVPGMPRAPVEVPDRGRPGPAVVAEPESWLLNVLGVASVAGLAVRGLIGKGGRG